MGGPINYAATGINQNCPRETGTQGLFADIVDYIGKDADLLLTEEKVRVRFWEISRILIDLYCK